MDVSDRRMQVQMTQEAKIASDFLYIRSIFAVVGFVSALTARGVRPTGRVAFLYASFSFFSLPVTLLRVMMTAMMMAMTRKMPTMPLSI